MELEQNMSLWDSVRTPDPKFTKGYKGKGGFAGTATSAMWGIRRMTELFGPIGSGWGIDRPEFQKTDAAGEILVFCTVSVWIADKDKARCYAHGVGGDRVVSLRGSGPYPDDDAFKKAYTDAVGNALKFFGVNADVYMGLFDDIKYVNQVQHEYREAEAAAKATVKAPAKETTRKKTWATLVTEIENYTTEDEISRFLSTYNDVLDKSSEKIQNAVHGALAAAMERVRPEVET